MYSASGAFEALASVSYKLQKASKYEKIDKNSKILKSRFMEGAFYLWSFYKGAETSLMFHETYGCVRDARLPVKTSKKEPGAFLICLFFTKKYE